ncbi:septum formation protein Maf [bacterium]|nr:septum formation protein Maf [bacterium]
MEILLGSKSPRRKQLLQAMEYDFSVVNIDCDEDFGSIEAHKVAEYLAIKKSKAYDKLEEDQLLITSDTTVVVGKEVLNKPSNKREAFEMISKLSGRQHKVISGVALRSKDKLISFSEVTEVHFKALSEEEINHYIDLYKPFDKAGAYGIQEWIGIVGITGINGCYYNVMGLPCARLNQTLKAEFS